MGSFPPTLATVLEKFEGQIRPGDVFALNDPYTGAGLHLPTSSSSSRSFMTASCWPFAAAIGHQTDIGGRVRVAMPVTIPRFSRKDCAFRLCGSSTGTPVEAFFDILRLNVRVPDTVIGDVKQPSPPAPAASVP
jgi:N-methylhydantoinase B